MLRRLLPTFLSAMALAAPGYAASPTPQPVIIAHRGASQVAPENTLVAYRIAWQMDSDMAEGDFWLTKDDIVVALHDDTLERTTGLKQDIRETTFAELAELDAGSWKDPRFAGEAIPTLMNLLRTTPEGKTFVVEIKDDPHIVPHIARIIEEYGHRDRILIISFKYDVLVACRELMPDIPVKWLIGSRRHPETNEWMPIDPANVAVAKEAGFEGLNVSWRGVTQELVDVSREVGFDLFVYTVNDPAVAQRLVSMGVVGITTDVPDVMLNLFRHGIAP